MRSLANRVAAICLAAAVTILGGQSSFAADPYAADYQLRVFQNASYGGSEANWGGTSFYIEGSAYEIPDLTRIRMPNGTKWNDQISSLVIGRELTVLLFEHTNFGGRCMAVFGTNMGGRTGKVADFRTQNANLSSGQNWHNRISSLKIASWWQGCP